jgi:uncharacterized protein (DUF1697 family)
MIYVALLRGINVGGNAKVAMPQLKVLFEQLGFEQVKTYINSGNVVFSDATHKPAQIEKLIEAGIAKELGLNIHVIVRDIINIKSLNQSIPAHWVNDAQQKTDVIFLWQDIDSPDVLQDIKFNPAVETVKYYNGALVWNVARKHTHPGSLIQLAKLSKYKQMTVRNINTVRKLLVLMQEASAA